MPVLILSGEEVTKQFRGNNLARMIGIQGVYAESIFQSCTKSVVTCQNPQQVLQEIVKGIKLAKAPRKGPCIVDIPIDLQAARLPPEEIKISLMSDLIEMKCKLDGLSSVRLKELVVNLKTARYPLLWLGNGLRELKPETLRQLVEETGIPYLTSWTATDLFNVIPSLYAGHAGTYGSRAGNIILQSCDLLITLGTRLAIPQKGYVDKELARQAKI